MVMDTGYKTELPVQELGLISFPGVCTPTEAFAALRAGADALKALSNLRVLGIHRNSKSPVLKLPPSAGVSAAKLECSKAFPGEQLPPNIIRAWRAVLPKTTCLMPVGNLVNGQ